MKKETLTMEAIKSDLIKIANYQVSNKAAWRFSYIVPFTALAILLGVFIKNIFVGIAVFCVAAYHIVRFIMEYKNYKEKKKAITDVIDRGDIAISIEQLSHITVEMIYEPYRHGKHSHAVKPVTFFYFMSGGRWRLPSFSKHYAWSKDYFTSSKGLADISTSGDEFFRISLQGYYDIAYIYPCTCFVLDSNLKLKN